MKPRIDPLRAFVWWFLFPAWVIGFVSVIFTAF